MNPNRPLVSVIIPTFNCAEFLADAIDSILAQNYTPLEIIIVDDGSTDQTADVVYRYSEAGVNYVTQTNQGVSAARNHGLQLACGEIICFLDADDRWPCGRLNHHISFLLQSPDTDLVMGMSRIMRPTESLPARPTELLPVPFVTLHVSAATYRRSVFDSVGTFNPALRIGEDRDWFRRAMVAAVKMEVTTEVAHDYYVRPGSLCYDTHHKDSGIYKGFLAALYANLKRRRQST